MVVYLVGSGRYTCYNWFGDLLDMQVIRTREPFMPPVSQSGFARKCGLNKGMVSAWASGTRVLSLDKMEEVLLKSEASVVSEEGLGG